MGIGGHVEPGESVVAAICREVAEETSLTIEAMDLTADRAGLADAKALLRVLTDAVAHLEAQELPATLPPPTITKVANPFG